MKTKILASISGLLVSLITPLAILVPQVSAAVVTWDGEGADNNWTTAANWSGDTAPVDGDSVTLDRAILTQNEILNNDLPSLSLVGISVINTSAGFFNYTINGNAITITGNVNSSGNNILELGTDLIVSVDSIRIRNTYSTGNLSIGTYNTTIERSSFDGSLVGSGQLTIDKPALGGGSGGGCDYGTAVAQYPFRGSNSGYSGAVVVSGYAGLAIPDVASTIARRATSITVGPNASLNFTLSNGQDMTFDKPITFNGGSIVTYQLPPSDECNSPSTIKTLTLSGTVTATAPVSVQMDNANVTLTGTVTGGSNITVKPGTPTSSTLTINGFTSKSELEKKTYTGDKSSEYPYAGENQEVIIEAGATTNDVSVSGGVLKGLGTVGTITMLSGKVAPGLSPGCLTSGNLSYNGGSLEIEIAGTTVCTQYDQQIVTGTVTLGASTTALNTVFLGGYIPALNDKFTVISNDLVDAVTGTFTGLAEGATLTVSGVTFSISYVGGDGNDVVLTATAVPAAPSVPDTGIGSIITSPILAMLAFVMSLGVMGGLKLAEQRRK